MKSGDDMQQQARSEPETLWQGLNPCTWGAHSTRRAKRHPSLALLRTFIKMFISGVIFGVLFPAADPQQGNQLSVEKYYF